MLTCEVKKEIEMGYYTNIFFLSGGRVVRGAVPKKKDGKFNSFMSIGDIRVDENTLVQGELVTQGYISYFEWPGEFLWEFSSFLIVYESNTEINWAILILDDKHVLLKKGEPKVFQGITFLYTEEGEIKMF